MNEATRVKITINAPTLLEAIEQLRDELLAGSKHGPDVSILSVTDLLSKLVAEERRREKIARDFAIIEEEHQHGYE